MGDEEDWRIPLLRQVQRVAHDALLRVEHLESLGDFEQGHPAHMAKARAQQAWKDASWREDYVTKMLDMADTRPPLRAPIDPMPCGTPECRFAGPHVMISLGCPVHGEVAVWLMTHHNVAEVNDLPEGTRPMRRMLTEAVALLKSRFRKGSGGEWQGGEWQEGWLDAAAALAEHTEELVHNARQPLLGPPEQP